MNSYGIMTLQPKIVLQSKIIIFSKYSRRVKKRNSYTVTYTDPHAPSHIKYGRVEKFLTCPADSPDSIHVAVIEELEVGRCEELLSLNFPPALQCLSDLLCNDFVSLVGVGNKIAIPVEHIITKCFDISTVGVSLMTTLVCDSEVAN